MRSTSIFPDITIVGKRTLRTEQGLEDLLLVGFDLEKELEGRGVPEVTIENTPALLHEGVLEFMREDTYTTIKRTKELAEKAFENKVCVVTGLPGTSYQKFCFGLDSPNTAIALSFWISSGVEEAIVKSAKTLEPYKSYVSGTNLKDPRYVADFKESFNFMHGERPVYAHLTHNEFVDWIHANIKSEKGLFVFNISTGVTTGIVEEFRNPERYTKMTNEFSKE